MADQLIRKAFDDVVIGQIEAVILGGTTLDVLTVYGTGEIDVDDIALLGSTIHHGLQRGHPFHDGLQFLLFGVFRHFVFRNVHLTTGQIG